MIPLGKYVNRYSQIDLILVCDTQGGNRAEHYLGEYIAA